MEEPHFTRVAIIGLGLIGGSIASGLKSRGLADHIVAFDQNALSLKRGRDAGIVDSEASSVTEAAVEAELIIICVPVLAMSSVFLDLKDSLGDESKIITDVGSVKCSVFESAAAVFGKVPTNLVPGHPIAGSERHGVEAADPDLFINHKVILTPKLLTIGDATRRVREMWQALSADVVEMEPEHHDIILAQTSHLPHLLAYALVDTLSAQGDTMEVFQYAAGGFRDFSRIAASDPVMWRDIFATNQGPVLEILDRFVEDLAGLRAMIAEDRIDDLARVFDRSKAARDHFSLLLEQRFEQRSKEPPR